MSCDNFYEEEKDLFRRELLESNQYMDWLSTIVHQHKKVSSHDVSFQSNDRSNILKLTVLFFLVDDYLKEYKVSFIVDGYGYHYMIRDGENHYQIGVSIKERLEHYCKTSIGSSQEIDFSYILLNEKLPKDFLEEEMESTSNISISNDCCSVKEKFLKRF